MDTDEFPTVVTDEPGYVRITISGPTSAARRMRLLDRILVETQSRGVNVVLVDSLRSSGELSTTDRYLFRLGLSRTLRPPIKVAILLARGRADLAAETVARNRGGNLGVFTNESDALEWLLGSGLQPPLG